MIILNNMLGFTNIEHFPQSFRQFSECHIVFPIHPIVKFTKMRALLEKLIYVERQLLCPIYNLGNYT